MDCLCLSCRQGILLIGMDLRNPQVIPPNLVEQALIEALPGTMTAIDSEILVSFVSDKLEISHDSPDKRS